MFKFVVFCVVLWHGTCEISGHKPEGSVDTPVPNFPQIIPPKINDSNKQIELNGNSNFHAGQQIFYMNPWFGKAGLSSNLNSIGKELNSDYLVTNGIGAHKVHRRKLPWNRARQICVNEGGHLAVIRTDSEEKIVLQMMLDNSIDEAWLGLHDKFEEGDWISVLDEPLGETGWARWSKNFTPNPDNHQGKQHCARIVRNGGGMDDDNCELAKSFVCKI